MNVDLTSLTITGHGRQPVPNQFLRQHRDTSTLTLLLPGQGYTARMPLFYYTELIAFERGWDVLSVDYSYPALDYHDDLDVRKQRLEKRKLQLCADVSAALAEGLRQRPYTRVVLVGKSLGTRAMAHLLANGIDREVWNVWLTPLIDEPEVREQIERSPDRTFVAIGTDDFAFDEAYLDRMNGLGGVEVVAIDRADHSLDIPDDIAGSIRAMGEVMSRLDAFLPGPADDGTAAYVQRPTPCRPG